MRIRHVPAAALALFLLAAGLPVTAEAAQTGQVFLVQGIVGSTWEFSLDGEVVDDSAEAKQVLGAYDLAEGSHRVEATSTDGDRAEASIEVKAGQSVDVVLHLPADAGRPAVITRFVNNRSAVPDGNTRLSIAHTAAVGPADIEVDGRVLFSDVASGEELTVVVPADTYKVAVLPALSDEPPVLGPVDLAVPPGKVLRVFAVGVAERGTMDAIIHTMTVPVKGSSEAPATVPGGTGGQHAAPDAGPLLWGGLLALAGALALGATLVRGRSEPGRA